MQPICAKNVVFLGKNIRQWKKCQNGSKKAKICPKKRSFCPYRDCYCYQKCGSRSGPKRAMDPKKCLLLPKKWSTRTIFLFCTKKWHTFCVSKTFCTPKICGTGATATLPVLFRCPKSDSNSVSGSRDHPGNAITAPSLALFSFLPSLYPNFDPRRPQNRPPEALPTPGGPKIDPRRPFSHSVSLKNRPQEAPRRGGVPPGDPPGPPGTPPRRPHFPAIFIEKPTPGGLPTPGGPHFGTNCRTISFKIDKFWAVWTPYGANPTQFIENGRHGGGLGSGRGF